VKRVQKPSNSRPCKGLNRAGLPCGRVAWRDGFCVVHHPQGQDLREVGKLGGRGRTRSVLGISDEAADDRLRALAKRQLEGLLTSENESVRLRAAASLYSYRSVQPPADEDEPPAADTVSALKAVLRGLDALSTDQSRTLLDVEAFNLLNRVGRRHGELERAFERFTAQLAEVAARKKVGRAAPDSGSPVPEPPR
jgi:hypothetical protein